MNLDAEAGSTYLPSAKPNLSFTLSPTNGAKRIDSWSGIDKLKHYSVSLILTTSVYYYMKKPLGYSNVTSLSVTIPFAFFVGLGKEFKDKREAGNHFSVKDLIVDIMGIASGWVIVNNIR